MKVLASILLVFLLIESSESKGRKKKCTCKAMEDMLKVLEDKLGAKIATIQDSITALQEQHDEEDIEVVSECSAEQTNTDSFTNVALNAEVTLSSRYHATSPGSLLVDGVRKSSWPCACTTNSANPFMILDLGKVYDIHSVYILNRGDCCPERLFNLSVLFGETLDTLTERVYHEGPLGSECTLVIPGETRARYVKIEINGFSFLTVCEFEVYSRQQ